MEALNRKGGTSRRKSSGLRALQRPPLPEMGLRVDPDARNVNMSRMLRKRSYQGQEAKFQGPGRSEGLSALFRVPTGLHQRDYNTSANHEDLQGVKDPR
jgi:hypothetical protein